MRVRGVRFFRVSLVYTYKQHLSFTYKQHPDENSKMQAFWTRVETKLSKDKKFPKEDFNKAAKRLKKKNGTLKMKNVAKTIVKLKIGEQRVWNGQSWSFYKAPDDVVSEESIRERWDLSLEDYVKRTWYSQIMIMGAKYRKAQDLLNANIGILDRIDVDAVKEAVDNCPVRSFSLCLSLSLSYSISHSAPADFER